MAYSERDAIEFILANEGTYSNDARDPGGETKWGLTAAFLSGFNKTLSDIKSVEDAREIYETFIKKTGLSKLFKIHDGFAVAFIDLAINIGLHGATVILQRGLNRFNAELLVDGKLGPKTRAALERVLGDVCTRASFILIFNNECVMFYLQLVNRRPSLLVFLRGWLNRQSRRHVLMKTASSGGSIND